MEDKRIENLVREVFKMAEGETASHTRYALAKHIEGKIKLSSKTLERAHDRYITKTNLNNQLQSDSIDLMCNYLGYDNFTHYAQGKSIGNPKKNGVNQHKTNNYLLPSVWGLVTIVSILLLWPKGHENVENSLDCMTWADSLYIPVSCDTGSMSDSGIPILPIDKIKMKNFKKINVNMATPFFSEETGKPLVWYYTKSKNETEYYTAPGLHPITGKTLKAITEHIIMTRVQMHSYKPDSYLKE